MVPVDSCIASPWDLDVGLVLSTILISVAMRSEDPGATPRCRILCVSGAVLESVLGNVLRSRSATSLTCPHPSHPYFQHLRHP
jgi:hypothetical protein